MWNYEKRLQFPVNIKNTNAQLAQAIISQYGGPDGESAASMRYLSQRYTMPNRNCMGLLTDIATEELGHMEMICAIVYQLTCNLSMDEIEKSGFNLDRCGYPVEEKVILSPDETIKNFIARREDLERRMDEKIKEIMKLLEVK